MIKRTIVLSFILLANIVLFAHLVIPHHHHSTQQVCIDRTNLEHNHQSSEKHHNHNGKDSASCILKQIILSSSNIEKQDIKCIDLSTSNDFQFLSDNSIPESSFWVITQYISVPDGESYYSRLFASSPGLRAPPRV